MTTNPIELNASSSSALVVGGATRTSLYGLYVGGTEELWMGQTGILLSTIHSRALFGTLCQ